MRHVPRAASLQQPRVADRAVAEADEAGSTPKVARMHTGSIGMSTTNCSVRPARGGEDEAGRKSEDGGDADGSAAGEFLHVSWKLGQARSAGERAGRESARESLR